MRVCAVTKYPPIQGGVSARCFWIARALAKLGHEVHVVTNAGEVEDAYRMSIPPEDRAMLEPSFEGAGSVSVVSSGRDRRGLAHIPQSNPFVSKLSSLATEVCRRHRCDVLFSYYYEPYGIAGHLASTWSGIPHVVQHAGSDRGRLMSHPDLSTVYREMLRRADLVITADASLEGLGIPVDRLGRAGGGFLPHAWFNPSIPPLDVDAMLAPVALHPFVCNRSPWRRDVPTFGVLGKVGETKGSYDLVQALARLHARGYVFNLLALIAGSERDRFVAAVEAAGLAESTWTLPLLPHWRVAAFLRACTAVCFIERRFPILAHRPGIPQEILACGVCAVLSREIVDKQHFRQRLEHGQNVLIVEDPSDRDELTAVLETVVRDPAHARTLGTRGPELIGVGDEHELGRTYETLLQRAIDGRRSERVRHSTKWSSDTRSALTRHMPATSQLLSSQIEEVLATRGAELAAAQPDPLQGAYHLMEALFERAHDMADSLPLVALAVLCFERDIFWLGVDVEGPAGIPQFPCSSSTLLENRTARRPQELVPIRSNWLRIAEHPANIEQLVSAAVQRRVITQEPALERATFLFIKRGDLARRVFQINPATAALVELCDGSRTVSDIVSRLVSHGVAAPTDVMDVLARLAQDRVVCLS